jgi:hypothetical protein
VFICLLALVGLLSAQTVLAEAKLKLEETEITGARELPKVLYIVPWKKTAPDSRPLPMRSLVEEVLSPIDMDVFRRQVRYFDMTQTPADEAPTQ